MKALSVREPWAWCIFDPLARKDVENRGWYTKYRGLLLIHVPKTIEAWDRVWFKSEFGVILPPKKDIQVGGIVGKVELVDVVRNSSSKWAEPGRHHFVIENPVRLPFRRCKGQRGLFDVDYERLEESSSALPLFRNLS